jgi:hypothetical protein
MTELASQHAVEEKRGPLESGEQPPERIPPAGGPRAGMVRHALLVASTGYILVYYSELIFWGSYDPVGMAPWQFGLTWFGYSLVAYVFLAVVHYFRVSTIWSLFIAGAVFGWVVEGVLANSLYGADGFAFPITISWTGLAWHALISVLAGWYAVRKILLRNDCRRTIAVATLLGIFYGTWAFSWAREQGRADVALIHFALYAFLTSVLLVLSYWVFDAASPAGFRPSSVVVSVLACVALVLFLLTTVRTGTWTSAILPVLLGVTYVVLRRHRVSGTREDLLAGLRGRVRVLNSLCLFFMPLAASVVYGLALVADIRVQTGVFILVGSTCVGFVMFAVSVVKVLKNEGGARNVDARTAA